jgi:hypothetical protein
VKQETRKNLELFIEKANKISSSRFVKFFEEKGSRIQYSYTADTGIRLETQFPENESIDAFILTFRFFIQDGDGISFRALANFVLEDPGVSEDWKQKFTSVRQSFAQYLDGYPTGRITWNGTTYTRREIMETFIFGGLAHANPRLKETFDMWSSDPMGFPIFQMEFNNILMNTLVHIDYIAYWSNEELKALKTTS